MNYYPQSMGPMRAPFVPYLDQLSVGPERVVYQPHLQTIVPSGGSYYTRRTPIHPPTITVQCEAGMFAVNYHELRKDVTVDEVNELAVPPWLERNPTPQELAVEEKFRSQEEQWEIRYWAGMEKKMREAAKAQERGANAGRMQSLNATTSILKPGVSTSPSHIQKADSFRRVLKKDSSQRSGGAASSKGGAGAGGAVGADSNYTGSECGTARPYERRNSVASSVAAKSIGGRGASAARQQQQQQGGNNSTLRSRQGDDARSVASASSANPRLVRVLSDKAETESICSIISSVYSDEDARRARALQSLGNSSAGVHAGGSAGKSSVSSRSGVKAASAAGGKAGSAAGGGAAGGSSAPKMSPRQRMLQQQEKDKEKEQQIVHQRYASSASSSASTVVGGGGLHPSAPHPNNAPLPTMGSESATTPHSSKCFVVAEGTDPFAWGAPAPAVVAWLQEALVAFADSSPRSADSSPVNNNSRASPQRAAATGSAVVTASATGASAMANEKKGKGTQSTAGNAVGTSGANTASSSAAVGGSLSPPSKRANTEAPVRDEGPSSSEVGRDRRGSDASNHSPNKANNNSNSSTTAATSSATDATAAGNNNSGSSAANANVNGGIAPPKAAQPKGPSAAAHGSTSSAIDVPIFGTGTAAGGGQKGGAMVAADGTVTGEAAAADEKPNTAKPANGGHAAAQPVSAPVNKNSAANEKKAPDAAAAAAPDQKKEKHGCCVIM